MLLKLQYNIMCRRRKPGFRLKILSCHAATQRKSHYRIGVERANSGHQCSQRREDRSSIVVSSSRRPRRVKVFALGMERPRLRCDISVPHDLDAPVLGPQPAGRWPENGTQKCSTRRRCREPGNFAARVLVGRRPVHGSLSGWIAEW